MLHRIKEFRIKFGMTQLELADKIGITKQQLILYESGVNELPLKRLIVIAEVFNVKVVDLIAL
jgi:DNA-binding XRE family transcriptional regulator